MADEKKKGKWIKFGDRGTYESPSGRTVDFDLSKLDNVVFAFYGKKQWIADNAAGKKTDDEKIEAMKAAYDEAVEKGTELTTEGKVRIVGKVRSNAAGPRTQDAIILPKLSTFTKDELGALKMTITLGMVKVSEELGKLIDERLAELGKGKKG